MSETEQCVRKTIYLVSMVATEKCNYWKNFIHVVLYLVQIFDNLLNKGYKQVICKLNLTKETKR